jgi:hypothetical protein
MDKKYLSFSFCILMFVILLASRISAISVGTAPGVHDLGEVKPGKDYAFKFYLITNSPSDMLVSVGYIPAHFDIYTRNRTGRYTFIPAEASQEDISKWVEIPRNTLLLSPGRTKIINLEGGRVVKANEEVDVILHVPEDAEPGYHAGGINLGPQLPPGGGRGTGVSTIAVTRFIFVFRVIGDAIRKGEVISMIGERVEEKKARIGVIFKNTGTTTITPKIEYLKIYDKFGNLTATLSSGYQKVVPGETKILPVYWSGGNVKPGVYRGEVKVSYLTGYTTHEEKIEIPVKIVKVEKKPPVKAKPLPCLNFFLWIILLAILGGVVYWKLESYKEIGLGATFIGVLYILASGGFSCILGLPLLELFLIIIIIILIIYWRMS